MTNILDISITNLNASEYNDERTFGINIENLAKKVSLMKKNKENKNNIAISVKELIELKNKFKNQFGRDYIIGSISATIL